MSTSRENPTPTRRWMKPLMVVLPTFMLAGWVYTALQFSRPPLSFLPKDFKRANANYHTPQGSMWSPVFEVSVWEWVKPKTTPFKQYLEETEQFGFGDIGEFCEQNLCQSPHPNGDFLLIALNPPSKGNEMIVLEYHRKETRPLYCLVKRLKAKYDDQVAPSQFPP